MKFQTIGDLGMAIKGATMTHCCLNIVFLFISVSWYVNLAYHRDDFMKRPW
jgi:hypothetical protein